MKASLTIRTYTKRMNRHTHVNHHQLVLPTQGNIYIDMDGFVGKVAVGDCIVIPQGVAHGFNADESSRFIVADMEELPPHLLNSNMSVFSVTPPLYRFIQFVENQLEYQVNPKLETSIVEMFFLLMEQQELSRTVDSRIRTVQSLIAEQLDHSLTITVLANAAYLSPTQFKKLFKDNLRMSVHKYITLQRMEKAKALLTHTDLPVQLVAERVGYSDLSAFSRRFSKHFGIPPREFSRT
ncbi:helix-turn-helix transcriptional regulator [Vibrio parahaemolyticus]|uniref:helix-turn-helix domain-containing protein n=1 Tax=Vibrio TaxID=662 RepID=UPI000A117AF8|nr:MULTISPECIES: AraC family transcriptional regulator [Vibrio]EJB8417606.1 helix-turn-helix domain-containing protein [Vibrio vulnificus]EGQ7972252.1 helix-turn-helix transcriptional regulator [Vibrio parahaemolyticus]EGQ7976369.1 helix-turn-helix transcriptional regulator [Vibrio parahaemolyticus]EGR1579621.1 AraC family transcriptional regulator [Vibrio parahaemolyticus]EGR1579939.1 AraC family transcriptional regulator [Vibrio parahaemolyticus]